MRVLHKNPCHLRQWLVFLLLVTCQMPSLGQQTFEAKGPDSQKLKYRITSERTVEVIGKSSDYSQGYKYVNVVIPEQVSWKGNVFLVTAISGAFQECIMLKNVEIPHSVTKIGDYAFKGCTRLTDIKLPSSLTTIGKWAFERCTMIKNVVIPNSVTLIDNFAFEGCTTLKKVDIGTSVEQIGKGAFRYCSALANVNGLRDEIQQSEDVFTLCPFKTSDAHQQPAHIAQTSTKADSPHPVQHIERKSQRHQQAEQTPTQEKPIDEFIPQTPPENLNTFAVIIGNESYQKVAHVPYALKDARIFAAYCQKTLGIPSHNIRKYEDATFGTMLSVMADIKAIAEAYDGNLNVIFYYAGHGVPNESTHDAFLLPVDVDARQTEACYPIKRLYKELGELGARHVVAFIDACFSGSLRGEGMLASARAVAVKAKDENPKGNLVVFSAASGDETAYPYNEQGHGLFTYFLLRKIQETKGACTLGELGDYVRQKVRQQSIVINRKSQTPTIAPSASFHEVWRNLRLR